MVRHALGGWGAAWTIKHEGLCREANSAFTLATSDLCQTGVVLFLKVDSSTTTGTSQVLATLILSNFENKIKLGSKVASVNAL